MSAPETPNRLLLKLNGSSHVIEQRPERNLIDKFQRLRSHNRLPTQSSRSSTVVSEKHFANLAQQASIDDVFDTVVTANLTELPQYVSQ